MKPRKVAFTEEDIKAYLDECISYWRKCAPTEMRGCYVDAYQSVRTSIFGETLPEEHEGQSPDWALPKGV